MLFIYNHGNSEIKFELKQILRQTHLDQYHSSSTTNRNIPSDALANMNFKTLGAEMPVISLPDGRKVQTGTIGALLVNIKTYLKLMAATVSGGA